MYNLQGIQKDSVYHGIIPVMASKDDGTNPSSHTIYENLHSEDKDERLRCSHQESKTLHCPFRGFLLLLFEML